MGEERVFYKVPAMVRVHCRQCRALLEEGDEYYMTDDSSWVFCTKCASGAGEQSGPRPALYPEHEREPLHKKVTLREQIG